MTSFTKDERFIIKLYELTAHKENRFINRYEVGAAINQSNKMVDTICAQLVRANFIKKGQENEIYLTAQGEQLAMRLLEE